MTRATIQAQYAIVFGIIAAMFLFVFSCGTVAPAFADPPPAAWNQPRPDIFPSGVAAHPSLDYYSTLDDKVETQATVLWAFDVQSGCSSVGLPGAQGALALMMADLYSNTNTASIYVASSDRPDLTIKIRCGATAAAEGVSGGVVGCLCYGFPYTNDIAINDVITTYPQVTQVSILCHEYCGHALSVWNEEYCPGYDASLGCTGLFAAVPNWVDIMNTGPDSRHYWGPTEIARWGRTHGSGAPASYGKGDGFIWFCGVSAKAQNVALYGGDAAGNYRYIGSVPLSSLKATNGCYGVQTAGYVQPWEDPCVDLWNLVDTSHVEYRSDRCL